MSTSEKIKVTRDRNMNNKSLNKFENKVKCLKLILYNCFELYECFNADELFELYRMKDELNLRKRTARYKKPPKSHPVWGPVYKVTWGLPDALWGYEFSKDDIRGIHKAIKDTLKEVFSEDGKYIISSYHYPHWNITSRANSPMHFHGSLGVVRFASQDNKLVHGTSAFREWDNSDLETKYQTVDSFFQHPFIKMTPDTAGQIKQLFREQVKMLFSLNDQDLTQDLFWYEYRPVMTQKGKKDYSSYMKNPALNLFDRLNLYYDKGKNNVHVRIRYNGVYGEAKVYDIVTFARRILIGPLHAFKGARFYCDGAFGGKHNFSKLLKFVHEHPYALKKHAHLFGSDWMMLRHLTQTINSNSHVRNKWNP